MAVPLCADGGTVNLGNATLESTLHTVQSIPVAESNDPLPPPPQEFSECTRMLGKY